jgi:hypothetical protein
MTSSTGDVAEKGCGFKSHSRRPGIGPWERQLHRKVEVDLRKGTYGLKRARGGCESGIKTLGPTFC